MKNLMRNTITIKKRIVGDNDADNNATYTYIDIVGDKPARIYEKYYREIRNDSVVTLKVKKVAFPYEGDLDLDEGDLVVIDSLTYEITSVELVYASSIAHHWELEIKIIEGE